MAIQNLSHEVLISCYMQAVRKELDPEFIKILLNEIRHRNIEHYLQHHEVPEPSKH